jgi:hypothetical protein
MKINTGDIDRIEDRQTDWIEDRARKRKSENHECRVLR